MLIPYEKNLYNDATKYFQVGGPKVLPAFKYPNYLLSYF